MTLRHGPGTVLAVSLLLASSARAQLGPAIFPTRVYETGGAWPRAVALGDLDRDGHLDVVVTNRFSDTVGVLRGDAWGTLEAAVTYPVAGSKPASVAIGDVDADGFLDVVTANSEDVTFSLLRGNAQGTLEAAQPLATCGEDVAAIALGDVTGDGRLDVVVACSETANVCVRAGNAQGGLDPPESYAAGGMGPSALALADVDLDGRLDAVVVNERPGKIGVLRQTLSGRFAPVEIYASGGVRPLAVAVGDLTGDGRPDIAVANSFGESIGILTGNAQGTFDAPVLVTVGYPRSLSIDDLDGDGRADLVACGREVYVLRGTAQGILSAPEHYLSGGASPASVAIGDVTRDGRADLVCVNERSNEIGVIAGRAGGLDAAIPIEFEATRPTSIVVADATQDGIPDVLVGDMYRRFVTLLEGAGRGRLRPPVLIPNERYVERMQSMRLSDVTGDGRSDILTVDEVWEIVTVIPANPQGGFEPAVSYPAPMQPLCLAVGDVSGDGRADVVIGGYYSADVGVLPGNAQGTLDPMVRYPSGGTQGDGVAISDVDGDGHLDVLVAHLEDRTISLLQGTAQGTLEPPITFDSGGYTRYIQLGDVTGDGVEDLVVATFGPEPISVLAGSPSGRFASPVKYAMGTNIPLCIDLDDLNGDGRLDIVAAGPGPGDRLSVLLGNAQGTFDPEQAYAAGGDYATGVALGDLDLDGRPDAVVANGVGNPITICLNRLPTLEGRATCFGDGTQGPCPCANEGEADHGCENSQATGGALLESSGESRTSSDDVVLTATGVVDSALCLFLQGSDEVPISSYGDGLLCAGGVTKRLFAKASSGGIASAPGPNDPSISARSASLGDPLLPGSVRVYQALYRDGSPAFCGTTSFNASRGWLLAWQQ